MATAAEYAQWIVANADKKGTPEFETVARAYQLIRQQEAPKTQAGFIESFGEGATGLSSTPAAAAFAANTTPETRQALVEAQQSKHAQTSFADIHNLADAGNWAKQMAGQSMGFLAAPGLAAAGTALMKGPGPAKVAGLGVLGAQYLTQTLGRQAQEQQQQVEAGQTPTPTSVPKAIAGAAGETALDVLGFEFFAPVFRSFPIVGKLFGTEGEQAAKIAADDLAEAIKNKALKRRHGMVQGIARGVAFEVPQEIAQQALERWQAGLPLADADARREYTEAGAGALLLGSGLGGLHGIIDTHEKKAQAAQIVQAAEDKRQAEENAKKEAAKAEALAEESRVAEEKAAAKLDKSAEDKIPHTPEEATALRIAKQKEAETAAALAPTVPDILASVHTIGGDPDAEAENTHNFSDIVKKYGNQHGINISQIRKDLKATDSSVKRFKNNLTALGIFQREREIGGDKYFELNDNWNKIANEPAAPAQPAPLTRVEAPTSALDINIPPAEEVKAPVKEKILELMNAEGKYNAQFIQNKLGLTLTQAREIHNELVKDGSVVKVKGKWARPAVEGVQNEPTNPTTQRTEPSGLGESTGVPVQESAAAEPPINITESTGVVSNINPPEVAAGGTETVNPPLETPSGLTAPVLVALEHINELKKKLPDIHLSDLADIQDYVETTNRVDPEIRNKLQAYQDLVTPKIQAKETDETSLRLQYNIKKGDLISALRAIASGSKNELYRTLANRIAGTEDYGKTKSGKPSKNKMLIGGVREEVGGVTEGIYSKTNKGTKQAILEDYLTKKKKTEVKGKEADNLLRGVVEPGERTVKMLGRTGLPVNAEGAKKTDTAKIEALKKEGKAAEYDPATNTFHFTKEGINERVVLHETIHAFTVKVLRQYETDPSQLTQEQRVGAIQIHNIMKVSRKVLEAKYPEAYDSVYEFVAHAMTEDELQIDLAKLNAKNTNIPAVYTQKPGRGGSIVKSLWNAFTHAIAKLFKVEGSDQSGNAMLELSQAVDDILTLPSKVYGVGPLAAKTKPVVLKAPANAGESFDEAAARVSRQNTGISTKPTGIKEATKFMVTPKGYEWLVQKFQNDRRPLKVLQEFLMMSGKLVTMDPTFKNNLYDLICLSSGLAKNYLNSRLLTHMNDVHRGIEAFANKKGIDVKTALGQLHIYSMAENEFERRKTKYIMNVPLDNSKLLTAKEVGFPAKNQSFKDTAAGFRERMLNNLAENTDLVKNGVADKYRDVMTNLATKYASNEQGTSMTTINSAPHTMSLDPDDRKYDVIGEYSREQMAQWREKLLTDPARKQYEQLMDAVRRVQEKTIELDKIANFWSQPVDNFKQFYGWKNYVPFKGKPNKENLRVSQGDSRFELRGKRLGGDLNEVAQPAEGRVSDSDNPILQVLVDGTKSAMRAGRKDVSLAVKNLVEQKHIKGKIEKTISFSERYRGIDTKEFKGTNKILHYKPDGSIDVIDIHDNHYRDAIRRGYTNPQPFIQGLNQLTSGIGHLHTRYNPAFHPYNFVRDALTNAFSLGAEKGYEVGGDLLNAVASNVIRGGFWKAGKITQLYNAGKMDELHKLYENDVIARDMMDFLGAGGEVTYVQGLALKGQFDQLIKDIGKDKFVKTKDQFNKYVDIWSGTFELASRAATFGVMKRHIIDRMTKEGKETTSETAVAAIHAEAAAYSKNLANFEQVGEWGKAAGAFFMFFRPAATGAVRAIDAAMPAFQNTEEMIKRLPEEIQSDPAAVAQYRKNHALAKHNAQTMLYGLAGAGFTMYMMAYLAAGEDDAGRNQISTDDMALWTRNLRLPLKFMGSDGYLQMPWGFGLGAIAAMGAQVGGWAYGSATTKDLLANTINIGLDSYLPLPVSRIDPIVNMPAWIVDSIIPSAIRPLVEFTMNTDSLGRSVYNDRINKYGDAYTGGANIPPMYTGAARFINEITNGEVQWQPGAINFWVNNYADGLAKVAQSGYGLGLVAGGQKYFDPKVDLPMLGSYIGRKSNYDGKQFASIENQIKEKEQTLKMFSGPGHAQSLQEYTKRNPYDGMIVYYYNHTITRNLNALRAQKNQIISFKRGMVLPDGTVVTEKWRKDALEQNTLLQNYTKRNLIERFKSMGMTP